MQPYAGAQRVHSDHKPDLSAISLDSLTTTDITSVARREQKLSEAAGAVFVITNEDIRRSGLTSLAEILRMAPGIAVAEVDGNKWAITTRGFNERFSDRTLFLLDGRALYSPLTSGVSWDIEQTPLADIDHIEVIRGPGATLWGANAMNGVVNIITKKSQDTLGGLVSGGSSPSGQGVSTARFGRLLGTKASYRIYGQYLSELGSPIAGGGRAADGWRNLMAGFRTDWNPQSDTSFMMAGNIYTGNQGETTSGDISLSNPLGTPFADTANTSGGNALARWTRTGSQLDTTAQIYLDETNRDELGEAAEYCKTVDLDFAQDLQIGDLHKLSWGANFRNNHDDTTGSFSASFSPANRDLQLYGGYLQDEMKTLSARLKLTAGGKIEHSFYNGFAFQPNVRAIWTPNNEASFWISIARAAATPSRIDSDVRFNAALVTDPQGNVTLYSHFGTNHLAPETVTAFEAGARFQVNRKISFDLATFHNEFSHFHTDEPGTPYMETGLSLPPHLVIPDYVAGNDTGMARGAELWLEANPTAFWKLSASYTSMLINVNQSAGSLDFQSAGDSEGSTPRNQGQLHSFVNLPRKLEFDTAVYYVGKLTELNVKSYTRLDVRVGWRPRASLDLSVGGRNLLQAEHFEWALSEQIVAEPIQRSAFLQATWSF